jgi:hypothetical protein
MRAPRTPTSRWRTRITTTGGWIFTFKNGVFEVFFGVFGRFYIGKWVFSGDFRFKNDVFTYKNGGFYL